MRRSGRCATEPPAAHLHKLRAPKLQGGVNGFNHHPIQPTVNVFSPPITYIQIHPLFFGFLSDENPSGNPQNPPSFGDGGLKYFGSRSHRIHQQRSLASIGIVQKKLILSVFCWQMKNQAGSLAAPKSPPEDAD
jgi:hypothetical protein